MQQALCPSCVSGPAGVRCIGGFGHGSPSPLTTLTLTLTASHPLPCTHLATDQFRARSLSTAQIAQSTERQASWLLGCAGGLAAATQPLGALGRNGTLAEQARARLAGNRADTVRCMPHYCNAGPRGAARRVATRNALLLLVQFSENREPRGGGRVVPNSSFVPPAGQPPQTSPTTRRAAAPPAPSSGVTCRRGRPASHTPCSTAVRPRGTDRSAAAVRACPRRLRARALRSGRRGRRHGDYSQCSHPLRAAVSGSWQRAAGAAASGALRSARVLVPPFHPPPTPAACMHACTCMKHANCHCRAPGPRPRAGDQRSAVTEPDARQRARSGSDARVSSAASPVSRLTSRVSRSESHATRVSSLTSRVPSSMRSRYATLARRCVCVARVAPGSRGLTD